MPNEAAQDSPPRKIRKDHRGLRRRRRPALNAASPGTQVAHPQASRAISPVWEDSCGRSSLASKSRERVMSRDALFRRLLALADVLSAYIAIALSTTLVGDHGIALRPAAILIAPIVVLASKALGLYDRDQHILRKTTLDELPQVFNLTVIYALGAWFGEALLFDGWLTRPQVFSLVISTFVLVTGFRAVARAAALALSPVERCVVVGDNAAACRAVEKLMTSRGVKATVVARVSLHDVTPGPPALVGPLSDVEALVSVVAELEAERAVIAPAAGNEDETLHAIRLLKAVGVRVSVLPRLLEVVGSSSTFDEIEGITLLGVRPYGLARSSQSLKRAMDIVIAGASLLLLLPVFVLIALAVKLDSEGPAFFRQPRIGSGGRRFTMIKYRSMVAHAERIKSELRQQNEAKGGLFKIGDDPRVTRVGRLLRKSSLDELPQLLNVLVGDMSLVGPRPLVPDEDVLIEGWQRSRLAVKPGMTGLWQIFGAARIPMPEMVKIDYLYGANWSVWTDLKILLRTVPYMLRRRGM